MDFRKKIKKALKDALLQQGFDSDFSVDHPDNLEHGDYATNVALVTAKKIGQDPMQVAQNLKNILEHKQLEDLIAKMDIARPGFINFWLSKEEFGRQLSEALKEGERYGGSKEGNARTLVVEYSSPNIAKRFGIGHMRSTIIGQAIYNLYKFLGYKTISENHLGDWGTQLGSIIFQIVNRQLSVNSLSIDRLEELYVEFNREVQDKPELWDEARKWFKKLEDGDKQAREIWQACVDISLREFQRIYDLLGVSFENMHGESFYEDKMREVIEDAKKKGLATEDQGALIMRIPNIKVPLILLKSDGATTYEMRDLAAIKWRMREWHLEKILYEVGSEQDLHFKLVFAAAELLGYGKMMQFVHIKHGLYRFPEGKISTRFGRTVNLKEVLQEAVGRARKIIEQSKEGSASFSKEEKDKISHAVGIGGVKYFDLLHHPSSEIIFSWEKMFLLTGNSGPYLQYTHARCRSVLRKAESSRVLPRVLPPASARPASSEAARVSGSLPPASPALNKAILANEELTLLRTFYKFPEVVQEAAYQYAPNLLCNFLYDLASKYNLMYNNLPILAPKEAKSEERKAKRDLRLALTLVTANILKTGLGLLGIQAPRKM